MVEAGLSQGAAEVALHTITAGGVEGFVGKLQERTRQEETIAEARSRREAFDSQATEAAKKTIEKWTPKETDTRGIKSIKEGSPLVAVLRDPAFHKAAADWYAPRAAQLKARGIGLGKGESPGDWLIRVAKMAGEGGETAVNENPSRLFEKRMSPDEAQAALSEVMEESPEVVKGWLAQVAEADAHHQLRSRFAKSDDETRAKLGPPREPPKHVKDAAKIRDQIERAAEKVGIKDAEDEPYLASNEMDATIAIAAGRQVVPGTSHAAKAIKGVVDRHQKAAEPDKSVRGAIERASEHVEATTPPAEEAPTSSTEGSKGRSIRDSLEAIWKGNGGTDDE
jgi:hypothetical protein